MNATPVDHLRPWTSTRVHVSLGKLFVVLWLGVSVLLLLSPEVRPREFGQYLMVLAPPAVPLVQLAWGRLGVAAMLAALTAGVVGSWVLASRHPSSMLWRITARVVITAYWLLLWFGLALSA
jgi:hypothetical protein